MSVITSSGNTSFSGFTIYDDLNTFKVSEDWSFLIQGRSLTNYMSSLTDVLGDTNVSVTGHTDVFRDVSSVMNDLNNSLVTLSNHVMSDILSLSKTFHKQVRSLSFTFHRTTGNLSGIWHRTFKTMSGRLPPPPDNNANSITSITQDDINSKFIINNDINFNIQGGNLIVNASSYGIPSLASTDNTTFNKFNANIQTISGGSHTSPSCLYLNRGNAVLNYNTANVSRFTAFGTYTVEFFFKQLSGVSNIPNYVYGSGFGNTTVNPHKFLHTSYIDPTNENKMTFVIGNGNGWTASGVSTQNIQRNTWYHFAFQKTTTNTFEYFLNGQKEATLINTVSGTAAIDTRSNFHTFGAQHPAHTTDFQTFIGFFDTLRLSSTARYSGSSYTIPDFSSATNRYPLDPYTFYVNYFSNGIVGSSTLTGNANEAYLYAASILQYGNVQMKSLMNPTTTYNAIIDNSGNINRSTSDEKLKTNIVPIGSVLDKINLLNPVRFKWKDSDCLDWGFIAQQVQRDFESGLVFHNTNGYLGMHITKLIPFLVKGVQELSVKLDLLKQKYNVI